jgi:hypothetical protein
MTDDARSGSSASLFHYQNPAGTVPLDMAG